MLVFQVFSFYSEDDYLQSQGKDYLNTKIHYYLCQNEDEQLKNLFGQSRTLDFLTIQTYVFENNRSLR